MITWCHCDSNGDKMWTKISKKRSKHPNLGELSRIYVQYHAGSRATCFSCRGRGLGRRATDRKWMYTGQKAYAQI